MARYDDKGNYGVPSAQGRESRQMTVELFCAKYRVQSRVLYLTLLQMVDEKSGELLRNTL